MKNLKIGWLKNKWIWILAATLLLISAVVFIYPRADVQGTDLPQFDFDRISGANNPTTDWDILQEALEVLGQRSLQNKDGWLHFHYEGYNPSDGLDHPFYPKDGHYITDMWQDVNEAGAIERILGIRTDTEGNELQVIACGDGICGNLSMLRLGNDYPGSAIGDFTPTVRPPSTVGISAEINALENPSVMGWVAGEGDSQTLYITRTYSPGEAGEWIDPLVGSRIVVGFNISSGESAYFKDSILGGDGSYELLLEDKLVKFEIQQTNPSIEERYAQVMKELKQGN